MIPFWAGGLIFAGGGLNYTPMLILLAALAMAPEPQSPECLTSLQEARQTYQQSLAAYARPDKDAFLAGAEGFLARFKEPWWTSCPTPAERQDLAGWKRLTETRVSSLRLSQDEERSRRMKAPDLEGVSKTVASRDAGLDSRLDKLFSGAEWAAKAEPAPVEIPAGTERKAAAAGAAPPPPSEKALQVWQKPPPKLAPKVVRTRGFLSRLVKVFDGFEDGALRRVLESPFLKSSFLKLLGTERITLYRGVSKGEVKALEENGWRYDEGDPRNLYKFATPSKGVALAYARKHRGYVVEIEAERAVPYFKLSRFWNRSVFTEASKERLILVDGEESVRLVATPTSVMKNVRLPS